MVNKKGMQYIVKVIVFVIILAMLALIVIVSVGMGGVEEANNFFKERFSKMIGANSAFMIPIGNIFNYNLIEVIKSDT
ncbi:MAG: hypothetical protein JSW73_04885 [Candidatus Woesearchaeota archaeon]|nr:MAG: hypothetical protein JSW73_04885 [Candidatus Woesearchaeota archaeon]